MQPNDALDSMVTCPKCKQPAMTPWEKLNTGPLWSRRCISCGVTLRASYLTMLALAFGIGVGGYVANRMPSLGWALGAVLCGGLVAIVLCYLIPLVHRDV
jgi:hypothetical protein